MGRAVLDPSLRATILRRWPLLYAEGADPALDRPDHARSGSALVRVGDRLVIIQDDANFLGLYDPGAGRLTALTLPEGPGGKRQFDKGRGNKMDKLDLEAAVPIPDGLLAFGSGSAPGRDRILAVRGLSGSAPEITLLDAGPLYRALEAEARFAGSELNVEGAVWDGPWLRLFNRGNGAPREGRLPVNASVRLEAEALLRWLEDTRQAPPPLQDVEGWDLGRVGGVALTFTDAAPGRAGILYLAAAEDSPDAVEDGPVLGVALGRISGGEARYALLTEADGRPVTDKAEGLWQDPETPDRAWVVFDLDDPERPTEMAELRLEGF